MTDITYTRHAETRMQQRAFAKRIFRSFSRVEQRLTMRPILCVTGMLCAKSRPASEKSKH